MLEIPLHVRFICSAGVFITTFYAFKQYNHDINHYSFARAKNTLTDVKLILRLALLVFLYAFAAARIWPDQIFPAIIPFLAFLSIFIIVTITLWWPEYKKQVLVHE